MNSCTFLNSLIPIKILPSQVYAPFKTGSKKTLAERAKSLGLGELILLLKVKFLKAILQQFTTIYHLSRILSLEKNTRDS